VGALRKLGHSTLMVPLYLPMTLDEEDNSAGTPLFFNGLNVYLEQKSAFFRNAPRWLHDVLAAKGCSNGPQAKLPGPNRKMSVRSLSRCCAAKKAIRRENWKN